MVLSSLACVLLYLDVKFRNVSNVCSNSLFLRMDGFIVSGDEDDYDDEWSSEEDLPTKARKSAGTIF